jgi:hypothetical protein
MISPKTKGSSGDAYQHESLITRDSRRELLDKGEQRLVLRIKFEIGVFSRQG